MKGFWNLNISLLRSESPVFFLINKTVSNASNISSKVQNIMQRQLCWYPLFWQFLALWMCNIFVHEQIFQNYHCPIYSYKNSFEPLTKESLKNASFLLILILSKINCCKFVISKFSIKMLSSDFDWEKNVCFKVRRVLNTRGSL